MLPFAPFENKRYYRIKWDDVGDWTPGHAFWRLFQRTIDNELPPIEIIHELPITDKSRHRLGSVGRCIYCSATAGPFSEEHVVMEALGAGVVLEAASCKACATATSKMEGHVITGMFDPVRKHLRIPGKHGALRKNKFKVITNEGETDLEVLLPSEIHPTVMIMPMFAAPAELTRRPAEMEAANGFWCANINVSKDKLASAKIRAFSSPAVDTARFCQLLAKTAHSYAWGVMAPKGGFVPLVQDLPLKKLARADTIADRYRYIGGTGEIEPASGNLHELGLGAVTVAQTTYYIVRVRLFAKFQAPTYYVVVGRRLFG
jgi:hypothetical protein